MEGGIEADALERDLRVALDDVRQLDPEHRVQGRHDVDGVHVLTAQAGGGDLGGHETIIGSAVPPSKFEYRFHSLNGVLNAHAQPVG